MTTLTQTKGLRRGLDLKVGAGLNVFRVKKPTRLNKIWKSDVENLQILKTIFPLSNVTISMIIPDT